MMVKLLQVSYLTEGDPRVGVAVLAAAVIGVLILIIVNLKKQKVDTKSVASFIQTPTIIGTTASRTVKRLAAKYDLNSAQSAFLTRSFQKAKIANPQIYADDPAAFDDFLRETYQEIDRLSESETTAEADKTLIFSIRTQIDKAEVGADRSASDQSLGLTGLKEHSAGTLIGPKGEHFPLRIVGSTGRQIVAEAPQDVMGNTIKFPRGSATRLIIITDAARSLTLATRILGYHKAGSTTLVELALTSPVESATKRRDRRLSVRLPCVFATYIPGASKGGSYSNTNTGTIVDLSVGGCAVRTVLPLKAGSFIRIDFSDSEKRNFALLGRIVRTNRSTSGSIMHIQFVKIPQKTLNVINSFIYDYRQD